MRERLVQVILECNQMLGLDFIDVQKAQQMSDEECNIVLQLTSQIESELYHGYSTEIQNKCNFR